MFDDVQAAFLLPRPTPAAGAVILAGTYGSSARPAADAGIAAVVQRIIGDIVLGDEVPDILFRPVQERVDLHQLELGIPLHDGRLASVRGLVLADGADPGIVPDSRLAQRHHFA